MKDYLVRKYILRIFVIIIISLVAFTTAVSADVGPKPALTLRVFGIETNYWLDLLVTDDSNYSWLNITEEERARVKKLAEYKDGEGFHPALLGGTRVPLSGKIQGNPQKDGSFLHQFSYVGVPETFKVAILTEEGHLVISPKIQRKQFQSLMVYDLRGINIQEDMEEAGKINEKTPWKLLIFGFSARLFLTLALEMSIAIMFGFKLKQSLKIILVANVITQAFLNLFILATNISHGIFAGIFVFILGEIFVIIIEIGFYSNLIKEKTRARVTAYAMVANIVSAIGGFFLFFVS